MATPLPLSTALSFEAQPDLYEPVADWTDATQYAPIKPLDDYTPQDHARLAWEILRRMPLYRLHLKELQALGIPHHFLYGRHSYLTDRHLGQVQDWERISVWGHVCDPPAFPRQRTLKAYVYDKPEGGWYVVNPNMRVREYWGLEKLPAWRKAWDARWSTASLFTSPAQRVAQGVTRSAGRKSHPVVNVGANEVLLAFRLDAPVEPQLRAAKQVLEECKGQAVAVAPASLIPVSGTKGAWRPLRDPLTMESLGCTAGVLLKQLELHPLWLRVWDAWQVARQEQGTAHPRLARAEIIERFRSDYAAILQGAAGKTLVDTLATKHQRRTKAVTLWDALEQALRPAMVPKWQARGEKYIERSAEAYRQVAALSFASG